MIKYLAIAKDYIPPVLVRLIFRFFDPHSLFLGIYPDWKSAVENGTSYSDPHIIDKVDAATQKVIQGTAAFERDSVTFPEVKEWPFPILAVLLNLALANNSELRIIDFGGALGSTYQLCKRFLSPIKKLRWCVVEQHCFFIRGKESYKTEELLFFDNMRDAVDGKRIDVILFSGVLQYIGTPYSYIQEAMHYYPTAIIIDRTPYIDYNNDLFTIQKVPPTVYEAKLPCRIFARRNLENTFTGKYSLLSHFSAFDPTNYLGSNKIRYGGWIWERINSTNH